MKIEEIKNISVIGAGVMGHAIAELAALAGFEVKLQDISEELVQKGLGMIEWSLNKLAEKGIITPQNAKDALGRISTSVDLEKAVEEADFVIEAVPEMMKLKQELFEKFDRLAPKEAILATNTSSLSITKIASAITRPDKVIGIHFFNPAVKMALVEVVRGERTSDETTEVTVELAKKLGKTPIVCKDSWGFIVNRILIGPYLFEPAWIVSRGEATIREIDSAFVYKEGFPMGPFELQDLTGIDIGYHFMKEAGVEIPPIIEEKVKKGELGRKTGRGFYNYKNGGVDYTKEDGKDFNTLPVIAIMVNEACKLIEEGVAGAPQIDLAMKLGASLPEGILRLADRIGIDRITESLKEPAKLLKEMVAEGKKGEKAGEGFYKYKGKGREYKAILVEVDKEEGIGWIILNRPHRLNALNADMCREIPLAFEEFKENDDVRVVIIKGSERAFCVGVDIGELESPDILPLLEEVFEVPERFSKLTIAAIDGYALGGGLEIALACDFRIASKRSRLGLPEIKLGLMPGGGGTQRLPRLIGLAKAKEMIMLGEHISAEEALEYGLVNKAVEVEEFEKEVVGFAKRLADGPPLALRVAKKVMNEGTNAPLSAGLLLEREGFKILFESEDKKEGTQAFLEKRKPHFKGK